MESSKLEQLSRLLHQVAETHHVVFAITDGADADWASWYSDWLVNLSPLPQIVGSKPVRSELTSTLVALDRDYAREAPNEAWERFYAARLLQDFQGTNTSP